MGIGLESAQHRRVFLTWFASVGDFLEQAACLAFDGPELSVLDDVAQLVCFGLSKTAVQTSELQFCEKT